MSDETGRVPVRRSFLKEVRLKLERADAHAEALKSQVRADMRALQSYRMVDKTDLQAGAKRLWFEPRDQRILLQWGIIFGDGVQNLRSALDHMVWGLTVRNGHRPPPNPIPARSNWTKVAFPIQSAQVSRDSWRDVPPASLWGVTPEMLDYIESVQPWNDKTGPAESSTLWLLRELSNIDKHRTISLLGIRTDALLVESDAKGDRYRREGAPAGDEQAEMFIPTDAGGGVATNFSVEMTVVLGDGEPAAGESVGEVYENLRDRVADIVNHVAENLPAKVPLT